MKVAQLEKVVDFPHELDVPWPYLQRKFGVTADSGNNTANVLHNFDEEGQRVYKINVGLSESIRSSEETFFRMFYDVEIMVCIRSSEWIFLLLRIVARLSLFTMRWFVPSSASKRTTRYRARSTSKMSLLDFASSSSYFTKILLRLVYPTRYG